MIRMPTWAVPLLTATLLAASLLFGGVAVVLNVRGHQQTTATQADFEVPPLVEHGALIDFKVVPTGALLRGQSTFRNVSSQAVSLSLQSSSCTCTVGRLDVSQIDPGATASMAFEVTTEGAKGSGTSMLQVQALAGDRRQDCFTTIRFRVDAETGLFPQHIAFTSLRVGDSVHRKRVTVRMPHWHSPHLVVARDGLPSHIAVTPENAFRRTAAGVETDVEVTVTPSEATDQQRPTHSMIALEVADQATGESFLLGLGVEVEIRDAIVALPEIIYWDCGTAPERWGAVSLEGSGQAVHVDDVVCSLPTIKSALSGAGTPQPSIHLQRTTRESASKTERGTLRIQAHCFRDQKRFDSQINIPIILTP